MMDKTQKLRLREDWALIAKQYPVSLSPDSPLMARTITLDAEDWWDVQIHEGFEVGIVLEGKLTFEFKEGGRVLRAGDAWLCNAWEPHRNPLTVSRPVVLVMVFLPQFLGDERFGNIYWGDLFAAPSNERPWVNSPQMRRIVKALSQELRYEIEQQPPAWESAVRLGVLRLLLVLSRGWLVPDLFQETCFEADDVRRILPALALARNDPAEHTSVVQAAAACALSEAGFRALFRKCVGMNFSEFRLQYRLSYVAKELMTTHASLGKLAERAGFADASHLHHAFLKRYGCTPGDYRASHLTNSKASPKTSDAAEVLSGAELF